MKWGKKGEQNSMLYDGLKSRILLIFKESSARHDATQ